MAYQRDKNYLLKKNFKSYYNNSLEKYRCESFFSKEPELIYWIDNFKYNSNFVDIGSNIGLYSIYSTLIKKNINCYSIEPFFKNYKRLLENISLNRSDKVYPLFIGLDEKPSISNFFSHDLRSSSSGGQINKPIDEKGKKFKPLDKSRILVFNLDTLVELKIIPLPNYIKIDVDGNEIKIIKGIKNILSNKNFISIFIEINNFNNKFKYFKNFFNKFHLYPDDKINNFLNHSSIRRKKNNNANCVNFVFSKLKN